MKLLFLIIPIHLFYFIFRNELITKTTVINNSIKSKCDLTVDGNNYLNYLQLIVKK